MLIHQKEIMKRSLLGAVRYLAKAGRSGNMWMKNHFVKMPLQIPIIIIIIIIIIMMMMMMMMMIIKHLMTGYKGNSEFCFPSTSMFPSASPRGTLRSRGNKTHCFPCSQSLSRLGEH